MRTKWKNKGWLALLLAVVLCTGFTSCKDDDDEDGGNLSSSIIGSWEYRDVEGTDYGIETYTFYADGEFELIYEGGSYSSGSQYTWNEGGTYTLSGSTLTLTCTYSSDGYISEPESYTVSINGERLTMTDEYGDDYVYYKKEGSSGGSNHDSDEDNSDDPGETNNDIVGTWRLNFSTGYITYTFYADGTGREVEIDYADGNYSDTFMYIYNEGAGTITVVYSDGERYAYEIEFVNSNMIYLDGEKLTRQ